MLFMCLPPPLVSQNVHSAVPIVVVVVLVAVAASKTHSPTYFTKFHCSIIHSDSRKYENIVVVAGME
jgi:fumarate reductase subunit C